MPAKRTFTLLFSKAISAPLNSMGTIMAMNNSRFVIVLFSA
jgi:hypothetical protein